MLYRVVLKYEFKNFYIAKDYNDRWYKVLKNKVTKKFQVAMDYYIYATATKGVIFNTLLPLTNEEAGVVQK